MKILAKNYVWTILLGLIFVLSTCDIVGLGNRVNTEKPVISIPGDSDAAPGAFLDGNHNIISLDIQQEFGIEEVYLEIEYTILDKLDDKGVRIPPSVRYNGSATDRPRVRIPAVFEESEWRVYLSTEKIVNHTPNAQQDTVTGIWYDLVAESKLDEDGNKVGVGVPEGMEDGTIKAWVTAIDVSGNRTTSTEMIYNVKNRPPEIELSIPAINGWQFDDQNHLSQIPINDVIYVGSRLMGIATDLRGMKANYPEIMLWPASENEKVTFDANGYPVAVASNKWLRWYPVVDKDGMDKLTNEAHALLLHRGDLKAGWASTLTGIEEGATAVQFRWPLNDPETGEQLSVGSYRFVMRTMDTKDNENYYPNRKRSTLADTSLQPKYIEILVKALDGPMIEFGNEPDTHYSGKEEFVIENVIIGGTNPVDTVKVTLSKEPVITDWNSIEEDKFLQQQTTEGEYGYDPNVLEYTIRIPNSDIKDMLGDNDKDINVYLHIQVVDDSDNRLATSKFFILKNEYPQVELITPAISDELFDDTEYLAGLDPVFKGSSLMGMAEDTKGILGADTQIMLWPESHEVAFDTDGYPVAVAGDKWATWYTLKDRNGRELSDESRSFQFRWPLVDPSIATPTPLGVGRYWFVIRTKNSLGDGEVNYYPNRSDTTLTNKANQPKYIDIWIQDLNGPAIQMHDLDSHYDGKKDFVVENVSISSPNPVTSVKITLSANDEVDLGDTPGFSNYLEPTYVSTITEYTINISKEEVKALLGDSSSDISAFLHIQVADDVGNKATTVKPFILKNEYPQIELITPSISGEQFDAQSYLTTVANEEPIFVGSALMGMAEDTLRILGADTKIMLWPVDQHSVIMGTKDFPEEIPGNKWATWYTLKDRNNHNLITSGRTLQFRWPLNDPADDKPLDAGRYRFVIKTKNGFNEENYFPNRSDSTLTNKADQPKYIEIWIQAPTAPTIVIPDLESHYDGKQDFFIQNVEILSPNPVDSVRIALSTNTSGVSFAVDSAKYLQPTYSPNVTNYTVAISNADIKTMLGDSKLDINAHLHIQVTDNVNRTTSSFKSFILKNEYPQIELITPALTGVQFDNANVGEAGNHGLGNLEPIMKGGTLMGTAEDTLGVVGAETQIMLWRIDSPPLFEDGFPIEDLTNKWATWYTLKDRFGADLNTTARSLQFRWPLVDPDTRNNPTPTPLDVGSYRFVIRTKNSLGDGELNYYPKRSDFVASPSTPDANAQPQFIEIKIQSDEAPVVTIPDLTRHTFGSFYEGKENFVVSGVTISSTNTVDSVRIALSNSSNVSEVTFDADSAKYLSPTYSSANTNYAINISNADVKRMLESGANDVPAFLHVQVTDNAENTTSVNRSFTLKNEYPQIELFSPSISGDQFDDSVHLAELADNDPIFVGGTLMGAAEDTLNIVAAKTQIMLWPIEQHDTIQGVNALPTEIDGNKWATWYTLKDRNGDALNTNGRSVQFRWPLNDPETGAQLPVGRYRFVLKTEDLFGEVNYYPRRSNSSIADPPRYIEIWVQAITAPTINIPQDFPSYFDGKDDFDTSELPPITIAAPNPINPSSIRIALSGTNDISEVTFAADSAKYLQPAYDPEITNYTIKIPNTDVKGMLGDSDQDISAFLHIRAADNTGSPPVNASRSFILKNTPPQIQLFMPLISGNDFDKNQAELDDFLPPLFVGVNLMGLATDSYGIEMGYPKIMIWPVSAGTGENGFPQETDTKYHRWHPLSLNAADSNAPSKSFFWEMKDVETGDPLPVGQYRFVIETKDRFENLRYYPTLTSTFEKTKYMQVDYVSTETPIVSFTEVPPFTGALGNFEIKDIQVSYSRIGEDGVNLEAFVEGGGEKLGPYTLTPALEVGKYNLTITPDDKKTWPANFGLSTGTQNLSLLVIVDDTIQGLEGRANRTFVYSKEAPVVTFTTALTNVHGSGDMEGGSYTILYPPLPGVNIRPRWVTSQVEIRGRSLQGHPDIAINKMQYFIGKLGDDTPAINALDEDARNAARHSIYNTAAWEDAFDEDGNPVINWDGLLSGWDFTYNFNRYRELHEDLIQEHGDLGADFIGEHYITVGHPVEIETDRRFYLPFYVRVEDRAGNFRIIHYKLCIDPNMDIPYADITYPSAESAQASPDNPEGLPLVGGAIRLSGTANDNIAVHSVQIRIWNTKANSSSGGWYIPEGIELTYPNPDLPGNDGDTEGWFNAPDISGEGMFVSWQAAINRDMALSPDDLGSTNPVRFEVRAVDYNPTRTAPRAVGFSTIMNVLFSNRVPQVNNVEIQKTGVAPREYFDGILGSETFTFSMVLSDADGIQNVVARFGSSPYTDVVKDGQAIDPLPSGWTIGPEQIVAGRVERVFTIEIDTINNPVFGIAMGRTGYLNFDLTVENTREPALFADNTYRIGVDNFYPSSEIQTTPNLSGVQAELLGIATDSGASSGAIQGIERVLVYFERADISGTGASRTVTGNGTYLNPQGQTIDTSEFDTYPSIRDTSVPGFDHETAPEPNIFGYNRFPVLELASHLNPEGEKVWTSPQAMVIDYPENAATADLDGDGTFGEVWGGSFTHREWGARLDTTLPGFTDGPYIAHYFIMDRAGNTTLYKKDFYIRNNVPVINTLNLGTDIDSDGSIAAWVSNTNPGEYFYPTNETIGLTRTDRLNTGFRIRNSLFGVRLDIAGGVGQKNVSITHVEPSITITARDMEIGKLYRIVDQGTTDWRLLGSANNNEDTIFVSTVHRPLVTTSGTVQEYVQVAGTTPRTVPNIGDGASIINTVTLTSEHFTGISDSPKDANGNINAHNERLFAIKVYDSAIGGEAVENQNARAVLVALDIENTDAQPPLVSIDPFFWNSATNNSLQGNSRNNGHIELEADLPATFTATSGVDDRDPKVSGNVIFRGTAIDNITIRNLYFRIEGQTSLAGDVNIGGTNYVLGATFNDGVWTPQGDFATNGYHFTASGSPTQEGHTVSWELEYNSSNINNVARADNILTVVARDSRPTTPNPSVPGSFTQTTTELRTAHYRFDVVPYIREVRTSLSGFDRTGVFDRSANGWYPVRASEDITINGFNLTGATVTLNGTALGGLSGTTATSRGANIGTNTTSGELFVTVNTINSQNNRNNSTIEYNKEPNGVNNNNLTNSRYLYVWNIGNIYTTGAAGTTYTNPFMRVAPNGKRVLAFGEYPGNNGRVVARVNNTNNETNTTTNRYRYVGLGLDQYTADGTAANNYRWYMAASDQTAGATGYYFRIFARAGGNAGNTLALMGGLGDRFLVPRIVPQSLGTGANAITRILISYVDGSTGTLHFKYGMMQNNAVGTAGNWGGQFGALGTATTYGATQTVATGLSSNSYFSALGALSNGRPVIAWYDQARGLVFSYGDAPTAENFANGWSNSTNWTANSTVIDPGKGQHVDMVVDSDNNIHLAYYNDTGGLYYAFIPVTGGVPNAANARIASVDTYLSAGLKIMISLRAETRGGSTVQVPYITYMHGSFPNTRNTVRVAWRKDFSTGTTTIPNGTDTSDHTFTGAWEVMSVPIVNPAIADEFVCHGVPTTQAAWIVPGGMTNYAETGATHGTTGIGNITNSIIVGYMSGTRTYDGAILKGNIAGIMGVMP